MVDKTERNPPSVAAHSGTGSARMVLPLMLPAYAMPGTDIAHGDIGLRARYAMSGTDLAYGATRLLWLWTFLPSRYCQLHPESKTRDFLCRTLCTRNVFDFGSL
eukprot:3077023-Rhodomonas_salina.7